MHFLVLGGSGQNGLLVIQEALARGHSVTAMVRDPKKCTIEAHPQLTVVKGTPTSLCDTKAAISTPMVPSAVLVALGIAVNSPPDLLTNATTTLLSALRELKLNLQSTKVVVNSSQGVGPSAPSLWTPIRFVFNHWERMRLSQGAHEEADKLLIESSEFTWVIARPSRLTEGAAADVKDFPED